jgi:hypothetical protein
MSNKAEDNEDFDEGEVLPDVPFAQCRSNGGTKLDYWK